MYKRCKKIISPHNDPHVGPTDLMVDLKKIIYERCKKKKKKKGICNMSRMYIYMYGYYIYESCYKYKILK
jgi:hypothetical protein